MSNTPTYWNTAKKYLSKKDKVMSSLINKYKSPSEKILTTRKDVFFHSVKVSLDNKSVLLQQTQFFCDLKKNVKIKLMPKQLITYHLLN
jgi:DNA-3-methyladenine glycosylase II